MKKSKFAALRPAAGDREAGGKEEIGKRARGHVQLSVLIPSGVRDDLRMAVNFDPSKRDISELVSDLITEWLDKLPSSYQAVRPSRRRDG